MSKSSVIFLHIPKTAGTTLVSAFKHVIPQQAIFHVGDDIRGSREELDNYSDEQKRQLLFIHGHLSFGWHQSLPQSTSYITFLREPVARIISHYDFVRHCDGHYLKDEIVNNKISLSEYVTSGLCDEVNNGQVRLLSGIEDIIQQAYGKSKFSYGFNGEEFLNLAFSNVENYFSMVGFQEYFDESLPDPCGNCDTCLEPVKCFDGTVAAQKALSCVYKTDERFGASKLFTVAQV